tara:strand:+ start:5262 stop:5414 length:153 start_codon:yes stop_codon:yes gene_type:complete
MTQKHRRGKKAEKGAFAPLISLGVFARFPPHSGEVAEWLKAHAWNACMGE